MLSLPFSREEATGCPNTTAAWDTKPLYLLTLVLFPDPRDDTGWDGGLATVPGAEIARDEINNRSDLLPGYHIELIVKNIDACSVTEAYHGMINLIKYTVTTPTCHPVIAVAGLICSTHTASLSPVAGHDGLDLIQLSAANSPIFGRQNHLFPHLWRFLGSATVYSDTVLALMDKYNWNRIGIVYDIGSRSYSEIAKNLNTRISNLVDKSVVFTTAVRGNANIYFESIIENIKSLRVTVLVVILNEQQASILLEKTLSKSLIYPEYTWIHIELLLQYLINEDRIKQETLLKATRGHLHLHTQTEHPESTILKSGRKISSFNNLYKEYFKSVKHRYNATTVGSDVTFAGYLYDQVWAFALAVNNSLPILRNRNLFIDSYTIGNNDVTNVFEEEMTKVSFQGAGGFVKFDLLRSVSTPVEIFWVTENGTEMRVGLYNNSNLSVSVSQSDLPRDTVPSVLVQISLSVTIILYVLVTLIILFTSFQLILLLYYRNNKAVKATSPYLSLPIFLGCYLLCLASILTTTIGGFPITTSTATVLFNILIVLVVNGTSLLLVTLSVKMLRVYRIFFQAERGVLGKCWRNAPLIIIAILLSILPNIFVMLAIALASPRYTSYTVNVELESRIILEEHMHPQLRGSSIFIVLTGGYLCLFLIMILFLAIRTRKIKHENFKDTKKLNLFVAILIVTLALTVPFIVILFTRGYEPAATGVMAATLLAIPGTCQVILFTPKVFPILLKECFPTAQIPFISTTVKNNTTAITTITTTTTSTYTTKKRTSVISMLYT